MCVLGSEGLKVRELLAFAVPKIDPGGVRVVPWIVTSPSAESLDQPQQLRSNCSGAGLPLMWHVLELWLGIQVGKADFCQDQGCFQADLDLWSGVGTMALGLAAASPPCLGLQRQLLAHLSHSSVCRTVFIPVFHFVNPITAKSAPFQDRGSPF